jgi:hypothetical protein
MGNDSKQIREEIDCCNVIKIAVGVNSHERPQIRVEVADRNNAVKNEDDRLKPNEKASEVFCTHNVER